MDYRDRQEYDKAVDKMLKEKLEMGITFGIFAIATLIGLIGLVLFFAFNWEVNMVNWKDEVLWMSLENQL